MGDGICALIVCALSGAFGGLVYSAKDNKLSLPGLAEDGSYQLGWLADILFGVAGGVVIFLLYPGEITLLKPDDISGIIKFTGLGIVGGYGGRLFLEKATSARLSGVEEEVKAIKEKEQIDAKTKAAIDRTLDAAPEGAELSQKELVQLLNSSSHTVQVDTFKSARSFRKKMTAIVYKKNIEDDAEEKVSARNGLRQVLKVLNALAEIDEEKKYHRTHGQLAYTYRALKQYDKAIASFSEAITIRDKHKVDGYRLYEFGRAACRAVHAPDDRQSILDDLEEAVKARAEALQRMKPLREEYERELRQWFTDHPDELVEFKEKYKFDPLAENND